MSASLACVSINEIMLIALAQKLERLIKSCAGDSIHRQTSCKPLMRRVLYSASLTPPSPPAPIVVVFSVTDSHLITVLSALSLPRRSRGYEVTVSASWRCGCCPGRYVHFETRNLSALPTIDALLCVGTNSILPTVSEQDLLSKIDVFVVLLCT